MIEYAKVILPKVSFSEELFQKELLKCINWVNQGEIEDLREWCFANFGELHPEILEKAFAGIAA